jgi:hypothetical protein
MRLARRIGTAITNLEPNLAFSLRSVADQVNASLTQEWLVAMLRDYSSINDQPAPTLRDDHNLASRIVVSDIVIRRPRNVASGGS